MPQYVCIIPNRDIVTIITFLKSHKISLHDHKKGIEQEVANQNLLFAVRIFLILMALHGLLKMVKDGIVIGHIPDAAAIQRSWIIKPYF